MVQTPEDAAGIVKRGRYPPLGERSFGPSHTAFAHAHLDHGVGGYFANARNENTPGIALIPMLESKLGVQNADAIIGTAGISGAFIGPFDLRCSLGLPGGEGEEDLFEDALKAVAAAGKKYGKPVGMMCPSPGAVKQGVELGFTFIAYQGDSTLLGSAARASVKEAREVIGKVKL
jgi:4-hydroxy-2-oxoheptanedioate aldolase